MLVLRCSPPGNSRCGRNAHLPPLQQRFERNGSLDAAFSPLRHGTRTAAHLRHGDRPPDAQQCAGLERQRRVCNLEWQNVPVVAIFSIWRSLTSDKADALPSGQALPRTGCHFKGLRDDFPVGYVGLCSRTVGQRLLLPGYVRRWLRAARRRAGLALLPAL